MIIRLAFVGNLARKRFATQMEPLPEAGERLSHINLRLHLPTNTAALELVKMGRSSSLRADFLLALGQPE